MVTSAEFAHKPHTKDELLELARTALSLRDDHVKFVKKWPEETGEALPDFSSNYGIGLAEKSTPATKAKCEWQLRVKKYFEQAEDHFSLRGENGRWRWARFGVSEFGPGSLDVGKPTIDFFSRHLDLFARELAEFDPRAAIELRIEAGELPKLLRDARKTATPKLTQPSLAAKLGVSADTVKSWEHKRSKLTSENRQKVVEFLLNPSQALSHYSTRP